MKTCGRGELRQAGARACLRVRRAAAQRLYARAHPGAALTTTAPAEPAAAPRPRNLVGVAILILWLALGAALVVSPSGPIAFGFVMVGWILAVMAHEFSHAYVAWLGGDHTVVDKGYLSFDPRRYGDIGTSLVIPLLAVALGGIGFPGGAVYLRPDLMRTKAWRAASSLAGPGATLAVLVVLAAVLAVYGQVDPFSPLYASLTVLAFLQATALILNLLPIPGLDGFNAIRHFLPKRLDPLIRKAEGLAMIALLAAIFLIPGASRWLFGAAADLSFALGLSPDALREGWGMFRFWL
jgi:Zn-dependent protease